MPKLTLANIGNLQNETTVVSTINANNALIQTAVENTLSRDATAPNQMVADLDMNSKRILNLPQPLGAAEPLRLQELSSFLGTGVINAIPVGGSTGGFLQKTSNADYAVNWDTAPNFAGSVSGVTELAASAVATGTLTLPAATDTLVGRNTVDTLTNKAYAPGTSGNNLTISGLSVNSTTGSGNVLVRDTAPTIASATMTSATLNACATGAGANGLYLSGATTGFTLLNAQSTASGTVTIPSVTDTLIGKATTDALTNKTFNTASTGNVLQINSNTISSNTGTGAVNVLQTSPTLITPALGVATATSINAAIVSPGHYTGEPSTANALTGEIGEYVSSSIASGSAISLTSPVGANVTSISLTAGDWDVCGFVGFLGGATTQVPYLEGSISTVSATGDYTVGRWANWQAGFASATPFASGSTGASEVGVSIIPNRLSLSATTTVYLVARSQFSVSSCTAYGIIRARRAR